MNGKANTNEVSKILTEAYNRKMSLHPSYSKTALARDLQLSSVFVVNMLSGKKNVPPKHFEKICYLLEIDFLERKELLKLLLKEMFGETISEELIPSSLTNLKKRKLIPPSNALLSNWWTVAILESLQLERGKITSSNLALKLNLKESLVTRTINDLIKYGFVEKKNGKYKKINPHLYVPTGRSHAEVRNFHDQMIAKARIELSEKKTQEDFNRRLITGFTFPITKDFTEKGKTHILKFLDKLSKQGSQNSDCTDVYQCNIQFFPLTKSD